MAEKDLSAVSDEDLLREMRERGLLRDRESLHDRECRNEHYVSEDGDVEYFPFKSDSRFEGLEIRGLNAYRERLGRVGRRSAGGWNHDVDGGDWDYNADSDGDWDREDELIDIADRAADAYDMSEDYRDY